MPVDLAAFRARFPEFAGVSDPVVTTELTDALADLDAATFDDLFDRATLYLTAHRLASSRDMTGAAISGQGGMIAAASADGVSSAYVTPDGLSAIDLGYWSTVYGQRFLELRSRVTAGPILVG